MVVVNSNRLTPSPSSLAFTWMKFKNGAFDLNICDFVTLFLSCKQNWVYLFKCKEYRVAARELLLSIPPLKQIFHVTLVKMVNLKRIHCVPIVNHINCNCNLLGYFSKNVKNILRKQVKITNSLQIRKSKMKCSSKKCCCL